MRKKITITTTIIVIFLAAIIYYNSTRVKKTYDEYVLNISDDLIIKPLDETIIEKTLNDHLEELNQTVQLDVKIIDTSAAITAANQNINNISFVPSDSFIDYQLKNNFSNLEQLYVAVENSASKNSADKLGLQSSNYSPYFIVSDQYYNMLANKNIDEILQLIIDKQLLAGSTNNPANFEDVWLYYCAQKANLDFSKIQIKHFNNQQELFEAFDNKEIDIILSTLPKYASENFTSDYHFIRFPEYNDIFLNPLIVYNQNISNDQLTAYNYFFKEIFSNPNILKIMEQSLAWVDVEKYSGSTAISSSIEIIDSFKAYQKYIEENYENTN